MKIGKRMVAVLCVAAMQLSMLVQGLMPMTAYAGSTTGFTETGGGSECIYAQLTGLTASEILGVSWTGSASGSLSAADIRYLVRDNGTGVRIDIPGISAGVYTLSVTTEKDIYTSPEINVTAYDRSGFAHFNYSRGVGAYKDDGTLKDNAVVLYVTDENKNSVQLSYGGKTVTGIGNILNSVGQESSGGLTSNGGAANTNQGIIKDLALAGKPLVVRFLGTVTDSGLRTRGAFDASKPCLINGLTAYDSVDQGGTAGDNGHMARIQSGKDITLEGVGSDAVIDGWGFHFIAQSSNPELGKSFEVRNLTFINTAEDAVGMEGQQASKNASSDLTASVERCWIHNNEFFCPEISTPAESDKGEGDGSVDFKRGMYFTCSYNYFEGCHKTNLVGSADYSLQFNLTYHHNYWFMCSARGPLTRRANVHMYNNVFEMQTDYAMNTRADAYIFSEYNLFYACKSPHAVEAGAIKSFNDSLASPLYKKGSPATVVSDRSEIVPNNCAFSARNIDYSRFDTDSALSYIPGGNYDLQTDLTELRKVIAARTGVMGNPVKDPDDIVPGDYSLITRSGTNVEQIALPYEKTYSATEGKFSKKCYAFEVTAPAEVTVSYGTNPGVLVNDAGEMLLEGSGSVANLPAGKYMIQAAVIQPGSYAKGDRFVTWKEFNLVSLSVKATDPDKHYHTLVLASDECVSASCTAAGKNVYKCSDPNCDEPSYRKVDTLPALGHAWGHWTVTKEATQTEAGSKTRKCGRCDATETEEIPAGSGGETGNVYTLTLDYNYDDAPDDIVMEGIPENRVYNSVDGLIPDGFGRTGYTLNGFYSDPDCGEQVSFPYTVTSSATLYAGWTEDDAPVSHYYLIFDANGGSDVPTAALPSSGSYEITQTSTRKGYRFEGWFDSPAGGEKVTALSISSVTDNVTVYAHWEKDENVDESFVAASFINDINALSDYEKYGHILDYKDEQGQTVKGSAYKAGTNGNDDNPLIYGPFTFTDWKIPSKQKDTIAALYEGTTSGTLKVEAPAASVLTIKGRTTDGDNANYTLTGPDGRAYLPEESGKTNKFSGKTIETRTYKLGMAGVYTLAYDGEKQTAEGGNVGEVRFAEVNLKGVNDESADPWHIVKFVQKSEAESGTAREISLIKKAHGDFLDEDDFPSPSLDAGDVFNGWYPENGTPEGALKPEEIAGERVMNDMIYHAAIEKAESVVTYTVGYSISGNVLYKETVKAGDTLSDIPVVSVPAGASFKGWSETENGTLINTDTWVPAEDDTLYAVIEKVSTEPRAWVYDVTAHGTTYSNATDVYTLTDTSSTKTGTDSMFVVSGSLKSSTDLTSGTVTVNPGLTCGPYPSSNGKYYLKMESESKTSITFTAPHDGCTLYVFTDTVYHEEKINDKTKTFYSRVLLDGEEASAPFGESVITITDIKKGSHSITKKDSINVGAFVLVDKPESTKYVLSVLDPYFAGVESSLIPGEYLKGTVVSFSAKPGEGYKDLQVTKIIGSDETPLEPDEDGLYSVTMDSDVTIGLKADADTSVKYSVEVRYNGASSDLTPGFYPSGQSISFNARLNPGCENLKIEVHEITGEGEHPIVTDKTNDCLTHYPDGSYSLKINEYNVRVHIFGQHIDPTGLAITNGTEEIAKYPGSPEGTLEVGAGASLTLSTNVLPAEAVCYVLWTSGDEKIAKVSRGRIIPIAAGETVITAKVDGHDDIAVNIALKVTEPQPESASIKCNGSEISEDLPLNLHPGDTAVLTPSVLPAGVKYTATFESGTTSVATMEGGRLTAVGAGEAVITLTVKGAGADAATLTAKAKVVVKAIIPTDLILKDSKGQTLSADSLVELKVGDKFPVTAVREPEGAIGTVTFESDKPSVAAVDQTTGEVTAVSAGTAQITARLVWSTAGQSQTGQMESHFKVKVTSSGPEPTPGAEDVEMLPGEVKRLNLFENHYTYPVRWTLESADPKGCVTLKNGVVTAKPLKKGTTKAEAVVKAAYNGAIFTYNIKIDCDVPAAKAIPNGKKKIELKAPKKLNLNVGDAKKKSVTVKIPAELREGVSEDSIGCEMTVDDVCEIGKPVFDAKKTKATFEVDPVDAGATYIIWSMTRGEEETVAVTEVIVKKPRQEDDFTIAQTMDLSVGEIGMILVEDTANNTDPKDLSFSVKGKGIKVSKSGAVAAVIPGSSGTVTVKAGKIKREVRVTVSGDHASDYLMLNKALLSVKPGKKGKTASLTLKRVVTPKKKVELPGISEIQVHGDISDQGIKGEADKSKPGKINVTVPAGTVPGTYLIVVEPEDTELNPVCCELIVK